MKFKKYNHQVNKSELIESDQEIKIYSGSYSDKNNDEWPLLFEEDFYHKKEDKHVYKIFLYGNKKDDGTSKPFYIALSDDENFNFLWSQKKHWLQNKDNIMWIINIVVAITAIIVAFKTI